MKQKLVKQNQSQTQLSVFSIHYERAEFVQIQKVENFENFQSLLFFRPRARGIEVVQIDKLLTWNSNFAASMKWEAFRYNSMASSFLSFSRRWEAYLANNALI